MLRILFVDSNDSIARKVQFYEHRPEYDFIFANNGSKGLELLQNEKLDAVITHLGTNGTLDDIEFMLNIKEIKPEIPVILVLSNSSQTNHENLLQAGAFACLGESVTGDEIMHQIELSTQK